MKVNVKNNLPDDVEVKVTQTSDGSVSIILSEIKSIILGDANPGNVVKIGEREYIVLEHNDGKTAIITKDCAKKMNFGEDGEYPTSDIRKYCNKEFYKELVAVVGAENIVKHTVKLDAEDGTGKGKTCQDKVSVITTENYRRYRELLEPYRYGEWWTATKPTHDDRFPYEICFIDLCGLLDSGDCSHPSVCGGLEVHPFCVLNSSVPISI